MVAAGGSQTIPEVQNFAKRRLRRTASDHSQSTSWYKMGHNSEKLLGFGALRFRLPAVEMLALLYTSTHSQFPVPTLHPPYAGAVLRTQLLTLMSVPSAWATLQARWLGQA